MGTIRSRCLDSVGDGSGTKNMVGNYAGAVTEFKIKPASDEVLHISRMLPFLKDGGSIDSGAYGNGISLTNGIELKVISRGADGLGNSVIWDITEGIPILVNPDWGRLCFDTSISSYGAGNQTLSARYTFDKEGSLTLDGANGEELVCYLNDNFSGLIEHYIRVGIEKI